MTKNFFNKLSDRQKLFCLYVAEGDNPSRAAIKAGYSEKGNRSRACRLIKKDEILAEIRKLQEEIASPRIVSVLERKIRLSEIARADIADHFEAVKARNTIKAIRELNKMEGLYRQVSKTKKTDLQQ